MRILLINYEYPPAGGGAATATQAMARALVALGHAVTVATARYGDTPSSFTEEGVKVRRIMSSRRAPDRSGYFEKFSFLLSGRTFIPGIMERHGIQGVIAFFSIPSGPIALRGRRLHGVPYVVSLRGGDVPGAETSLGWLHGILRPLRRAVLRESVAIVANSEGLRKMAEAADPFPVTVIPNGVDTEAFFPPPTPSESKTLRILFVGRLHKQKNVAQLLRQAAQLPVGSFALHIVGDGPERERLERLAQTLGLTNSITWHGWLPRAHMRAIYQSCDCLVNPSLYEGLPNAVLEAMACGLPVVASNVPGNDALVQNGENGFLFSPNDLHAITAALKKLQDAEVRGRLSRAARARALTLPSWKEVAQRYVELLQSRSVPR